jgi:hypothetical protein
MASFSIKVINDKDMPVSGIKVSLDFPEEPFSASIFQYTDKYGFVQFFGYEKGEIEVFVNGDSFGYHYYNDGEGITLKLFR